MDLLDTGNLNSRFEGVSRIISLSKYEIGNNQKGQVLGSVWVEGGGGAQCMPYALMRYRAGVLGAYVLFSLSLRY